MKEVFQNVFKQSFNNSFFKFVMFCFHWKGSNEIGKEKELPVMSLLGFECNGPFDHDEYKCNNHCRNNGVSNQWLSLDFVSIISYDKI